MLIKIEGSDDFFIIDQQHRRHEVKPYVFTYDDGVWLNSNDSQHFKLTEGCYSLKNHRLFVYEQYEGYQHYCLFANKPFLYAADRRSNVVSNDPYIKNSYLFYKEGKLTGKGAEIYRNQKCYQGEKLENGDEIWFMSFCFFYYDTFLYLSTFNNEIHLPPLAFDPLKQLSPPEPIEIESLGYRLMPEFKLPEFEKFKPPLVQREKNLLLQIAPSFTMSLAMLTVAINNILVNPNAQIIYLMLPGVMLISTFLWPFLNRIVEKKQSSQEYLKIRDGYLQRFKKQAEDLKHSFRQYRAYLKEYCLFEPGEGCFQRDCADALFNCLYLGEGKVPFVIEDIDCNDRVITETFGQLRYEFARINNFPYFLDLKINKRVTLVVEKDLKQLLLENLIYQLASSHRCKDLTLAVYSLDYKDFRCFAGLEHLFMHNRRLTFCRLTELAELDDLGPKPLVLLLKNNPGSINFKDHVSLIYLSDERSDLLNDSSTVLEYRNGAMHNLSSATYNLNLPLFELKTSDFAGLGLHHYTPSVNQLMFSDFLQKDTIKNNYIKKPASLISSFAFDDKGLLPFDLHENGNGPHGLIAGSTGSGKSELIVSLLLGLCINYPPDYLRLILIDYKGGGLWESLCERGEPIPHIAASITNLESDTFERLIVQIRELTRKRQKQFAQLSAKLGVPIMNIDDYLAADYLSCGLKKMAHLLIVVDEFAELKKDNPEVIRELISFARIGRSLGLHLLLATQRPSGVIDEEIWSNSRFKLALKVFSKKDSRDILHDECAAFLKEPGDFYLNYDGKLLKAHSIYAKRDLSEHHPCGIALLDERLRVVKRITFKKPQGIREAEWLCAQIKAACGNYSLETLNFQKPKPLVFGNDGSYGLVDDYLGAKVYPLIIDLEQHLLVYSSRKKELWGIFHILKDKRLILISREDYRGIKDNIRLDDEDGLAYLFHFLRHYDEEIYLVVEDVGALLSKEGMVAKISELLATKEKLFFYGLSKRSDLPYRFLNLFKQKLAIEITDRNDLLNFFGFSCSYQGNSFVFKQKLLPFVPNIPGDDLLVKYYGLLKKIPDRCLFKVENDRFVAGIDFLTLEEVYLSVSESVLITAFNEELLGKYVELFTSLPKVKVIVYNQQLLGEDFSSIVWLGEGQNSQHLFYTDFKKQLKEGEALLYRRGMIRRIKMVNE